MNCDYYTTPLILHKLKLEFFIIRMQQTIEYADEEDHSEGPEAQPMTPPAQSDLVAPHAQEVIGTTCASLTHGAFAESLRKSVASPPEWTE